MNRTLVAAPLFAADTFAMGTAVIVTTPFTRRLHDPLARSWARRTLALAGIELEVEGAERLDPKRRYVFMANHQSHLDVPCMIAALPCPVRFVAKRSLMRIPIFGQAMGALGTIAIDRGNPTDTMRRMREAQRKMPSDESIFFFAEGTRSADGEIHPFKKGGIKMAYALGIPIVPVAIAGTREALPKGSTAVKPGRVRVSVGAPLLPGAESAELKDEMIAQVEAEVRAMFERIRHLDRAPPGGSCA